MIFLFLAFVHGVVSGAFTDFRRGIWGTVNSSSGYGLVTFVFACCAVWSQAPHFYWALGFFYLTVVVGIAGGWVGNKVRWRYFRHQAIETLRILWFKSRDKADQELSQCGRVSHETAKEVERLGILIADLDRGRKGNINN